MSNHPNRKIPNPWPLIVIGVAVACLAFAIWKFALSENNSLTTTKKENKEMSALVQSGIPNHLVRDDGSYNLIAVIDGAGANKQFISNLQVINVQRQALGEIRTKLASLPKDSEEKSQLTKRGGEIEASLVKNMEFMTRNYGYSIDHNYLLIPAKANILAKGMDDEGKPSEDETKATLVKSIGSTDAYEHFESLRQTYSKEAANGGDQEKADEAAELLKAEYGFDVKGNYILQITKGALYANVK